MTQPMPTLPDGEPRPCRSCQYFTGPGCACDNAGHDRPQNPAPRPTLDDITSDQLDTLWDRAEQAEEARDDALRTAAYHNDRASKHRARAERAEALAREILRHFIHKGHPGEPCLQTGWISVRTVEQWRAALDERQEQPATTTKEN